MWEPGKPHFFNGTIDEVSIWNRSLSGEKIAAIFESQDPISCKQRIHRADDRDPLGCITMYWIGY